MAKGAEQEKPQPDWQDGVPRCSESCAHHDRKRCRLTGFRPDSICEPAVKQLSADVPTPEERAVLEAMAAIPDIQIDMTLDLRDDLSIQETRAWEAELARRAAKGTAADSTDLQGLGIHTL